MWVPWFKHLFTRVSLVRRNYMRSTLTTYQNYGEHSGIERDKNTAHTEETKELTRLLWTAEGPCVHQQWLGPGWGCSARPPPVCATMEGQKCGTVIPGFNLGAKATLHKFKRNTSSLVQNMWDCCAILLTTTQQQMKSCWAVRADTLTLTTDSRARHTLIQISAATQRKPMLNSDAEKEVFMST